MTADMHLVDACELFTFGTTRATNSFCLRRRALRVGDVAADDATPRRGLCGKLWRDPDTIPEPRHPGRASSAARYLENFLVGKSGAGGGSRYRARGSDEREGDPSAV
jgi:hypothetical protein